MFKRYYFQIEYIPKNADAELLAGKCINILHGYHGRTKTRNIGVSFPEWSEHNTGRSIAFVSCSKAHLYELRSHHYFSVMEEDGLFSLSDVLAVPDALPEVRFRRNNTIGKIFSGDKAKRLRRNKSRAESRGEIFNPELHQNTKVREFDSFNCVPMGSSSSGDEFVIHVQKDRGVSLNTDYSIYGLATNEKNQGSVPDFSLS